MSKRRKTAIPSSSSWDPVADWYIGWVGARGSDHHRKLAIPAALDLMSPLESRRVLDIGCGTAAIARHIVAAGGAYTGMDSSHRLLGYARRHQRHAIFVHGDATRLSEAPGLRAASFDVALFLLSVQDIDPLPEAVASAAWALRPGGRLVILMTHPCFRIPRQSGWGWDSGRGLQYRRIDRYLTPLSVPLKSYGRDRSGATRSHHRPLEDYVCALAENGLAVDLMREIPADRGLVSGARTRAERRADREIPLFLGLRAVKR